MKRCQRLLITPTPWYTCVSTQEQLRLLCPGLLPPWLQWWFILPKMLRPRLQGVQEPMGTPPCRGVAANTTGADGRGLVPAAAAARTAAAGGGCWGHFSSNSWWWLRGYRSPWAPLPGEVWQHTRLEETAEAWCQQQQQQQGADAEGGLAAAVAVAAAAAGGGC